MRPYRSAARAERDARAEQRLNLAEGAAPARPLVADEDLRRPFDWSFCCGGISWSLRFEPNLRCVGRWPFWGTGSPGCVRALSAFGELCNARRVLRSAGSIGADRWKVTHLRWLAGRKSDLGELPVLAGSSPPAFGIARPKAADQDVSSERLLSSDEVGRGAPAPAAEPPSGEDQRGGQGGQACWSIVTSAAYVHSELTATRRLT